MGTDVNLYFGPTIMVPEKTVKTKSHLFCCSSSSCIRHKKAATKGDNFCSVCGSANQNKEIVGSSILNPYEDHPDHDYDYWYSLFANNNVDNRIIYTPNFDLVEKGVFSVYDSEKYSEFDYDLGEVDLKANLEKFKELPETKEILELLSYLYLKHEITISYRLFKYCS